jgi:hypothetical protein
MTICGYFLKAERQHIQAAQQLAVGDRQALVEPDQVVPNDAVTGVCLAIAKLCGKVSDPMDDVFREWDEARGNFSKGSWWRSEFRSATVCMVRFLLEVGGSIPVRLEDSQPREN